MCYQRYGQRSTVNVPMGINSNTTLCDTSSSDSREIGWGVIREEKLWSNWGMMCTVQC